MGAKRCLATASGTTALLKHCSSRVDAGQSWYSVHLYSVNVIFVVSIACFVDSDPETFDRSQKIGSRITEGPAIVPVHVVVYVDMM
jgi:dTDP-4-amino-4,6-dideoxygalactose transaminase